MTESIETSEADALPWQPPARPSTVLAPLAVTATTIDAARKILARVCENGLVRMSVPPREDDEDMILLAIIERAALSFAGAVNESVGHVLPSGDTFQAHSTAAAPGIVLNATQLRSALEFVAPDFDTDEDQREAEVCIQYLPTRISTDGEPMEEGMHCWLADYPEEGCIPLRPNESFPLGQSACIGVGDFPSRIMVLLRDVADRNPPEGFGVFEDPKGEPMQDDADAAIRWIESRASPAATDNVAWTVETHKDCYVLTLNGVEVLTLVGPDSKAIGAALARSAHAQQVRA